MAENSNNGNVAAVRSNNDKYTHNFDLNEISPLRTTSKDQQINSDIPAQSATINVDNVDTFVPQKKSANKLKGKILFKFFIIFSFSHKDFSVASDKYKFFFIFFLIGTYEAVLTRLDISGKARLPFLTAISLCVLLLIVLIILIAFWPSIPYYMKADICVEKECLDASSQVSFSYTHK